MPPGLRLVQLMSVGYDTFDLQGARAAGVPVAVNGGANAIAVAEHAVMLMLATLKRLAELNSAVHGGQWRSGPTGEERLYELWHSTVGIVGLGRIGRQVAQRLQGWEATLRYFDPVRLPAAEEQALGVEYRPLEQLLAESDVVTVHVPLSDQTRHLIDARALSLMKPSAVLVNTSRGGLVDEAALAEALRSGRHPGGRAGRPLRRAPSGRPPPVAAPQRHPHPPRRGPHLAELAPALHQLLRQHRPRQPRRRPAVGRPRAGGPAPAPRTEPAALGFEGAQRLRQIFREGRLERAPGAVREAEGEARRVQEVPVEVERGGRRPYTRSPTTGAPIAARCTRIWCVRPVTGRHSSSVCRA